MQKKVTPYDKDAVWNEEIEDTAKELVDLCNENDIPCLLIAAVKNDETGTAYREKHVLPKDKDITLFRDCISDYFDTVPCVLDAGEAVPMEDLF